MFLFGPSSLMEMAEVPKIWSDYIGAFTKFCHFVFVSDREEKGNWYGE